MRRLTCSGLAACLLAACARDRGQPATAPPDAGQPPAATSVEAIVAERAQLDATVFADEVEAQRHEQSFIALWDDLRRGAAFNVLRRFPFDQITLGVAKPAASPDWGIPGIQIAELDPEGAAPLDHAGFVEVLGKLETAGWKIAQTEWHHSKFESARENEAARSTVSFEIHAHFRSGDQRVIVRGDLIVRWSGRDDRLGNPVPATIATSGVRLIARKGKPMFVEQIVVDPKEVAPGRFPRTSPIMLRDLDGDGLSDVVLGGCNLVYINRGDFRFEPRDFLAHAIIRPAEAGILADFTGDGHADYVSAAADGGALLLFAGNAAGQFPDPGRPIFPQHLPGLHALTAGDIDADGDLDLFAGQWKAPYVGGAMPTPYYDANDGHPDVLLRNDGGGKFADITESSGLAAKRGRRTFSASFVDIDQDRDQDLVVVADFSGLDLYRNDGGGKFTDITQAMVDQRHAFGMSHTFGDWNNDGKLDLYMVGMSSTTARRLGSLKLARPGFENYTAMRAPMTFGNRLLLGDGAGKFSQPQFAAGAARTGWAWGCGTADFDLDGDLDLYVANGHLSGSSAKDYCTRFWCHDLYTGNSNTSPVLDQFFSAELSEKLGRDFSWNGFEHNALFLNRPGEQFLNAAFLAGAAFEYDARAVVADDLDADGRPDLLVVEYRTDSMSQRLHIYRNHHQSDNHWIGLRLKPAPGQAADGAIVRAKAGDRQWVKALVSGDSFTSQHPQTVHFGLGKTDQLEEMTVLWPSGARSTLKNPVSDQYHTATAPPPSR